MEWERSSEVEVEVGGCGDWRTVCVEESGECGGAGRDEGTR